MKPARAKLTDAELGARVRARLRAKLEAELAVSDAKFVACLADLDQPPGSLTSKDAWKLEALRKARWLTPLRPDRSRRASVPNDFGAEQIEALIQRTRLDIVRRASVILKEEIAKDRRQAVTGKERRAGGEALVNEIAHEVLGCSVDEIEHLRKHAKPEPAPVAFEDLIAARRRKVVRAARKPRKSRRV
jgi:hypothetical protein